MQQDTDASPESYVHDRRTVDQAWLVAVADALDAPTRRA
jgi:hypothetical protein